MAAALDILILSWLATLYLAESLLSSPILRAPKKHVRNVLRPLRLSAIPNSDGFKFDPFAGGPAPPPDRLPEGLSRFLTQRAVQQQLYYYELNMDETHSNWLSEFLLPENRSAVHVDYHGINALPSADSSSYLCAILNYPEIEVKIKKPMGCAAGHGRGGTGMGDYNRNSNPYLKPRYFEYTDLIRPVAVATSLLTIREQISEELAEDLHFLITEGEEVLRTGEAGTTFSNGPNGETVSDGGRSSPFRLANYDLLKLLATKEALLKRLAIVFRNLDKDSDGKVTRDEVPTRSIRPQHCSFRFFCSYSAGSKSSAR